MQYVDKTKCSISVKYDLKQKKKLNLKIYIPEYCQQHVDD